MLAVFRDPHKKFCFLVYDDGSTYDIIHRMKCDVPDATTCCNETMNQNYVFPAETEICFNPLNQILFSVPTLGQIAVNFFQPSIIHCFLSTLFVTVSYGLFGYQVGYDINLWT